MEVYENYSQFVVVSIVNLYHKTNKFPFDGKGVKMTLKTRDYRRLADDDFMRWNKDDVVPWLINHHADPDHAPMDMDYEPLTVAFALALQDYKNKKEIAETRTKEVAPAARQLRDILIGVRRMLPQLFGGNENVLAEFGLVEAVSPDDDKMLLSARSCRDYWAVVSVEPEYAALAFVLNTVAGAITALEDARLAASAAAQAKDAAQNAKDITYQAAIDKISEIFNWYRGLYVSPEDMRWQQTPFGASWDGGEPVEPLIPWPGPAPIEGEDFGDGTVELRVVLIEDMVDGFWEGRESPNGPWEILIPHILFDEGKPVAHRELNVPPGKYEYRFTPVNAAGEPGLSSTVTVMVK